MVLTTEGSLTIGDLTHENGVVRSLTNTLIACKRLKRLTLGRQPTDSLCDGSDGVPQAYTGWA